MRKMQNNETDLSKVKRCLINSNKPFLFCGDSSEWLDKLYLNVDKLKSPSERPDAYLVDGKNVFILEHFQFDNGYSDKHGSQLERQLNNIDKQFNSSNKRLGLFDVNINKTSELYVNNFKNAFTSHILKLKTYKENVLRELDTKPESVIIGFIIEDISMFGASFRDSKNNIKIVNFLRTQTFYDLFIKSQLDFVLLAVTNAFDDNFNSYITRNCLAGIDRNNLLDLTQIVTFNGKNNKMIVLKI